MGLKIGWFVVVALFLVIVGLALVLFLTPPPQNQSVSSVATSTDATTTDTAPAASSQPLSQQVVVRSPQPNASVSSPFTVSGQVPGSWTFEAQFPIKVKDQEDNVIGNATAHVQGDWQTTSLVPFTATVSLDTPYHGQATLVLLKDNPSGLPQNDDAVEVPIVIQ